MTTLPLVGCSCVLFAQFFPLIGNFPCSQHLPASASGPFRSPLPALSQVSFPKVVSPSGTILPTPTISHFIPIQAPLQWADLSMGVLTVFFLEPGVPGGPGQPLLPCQRNRQMYDNNDTTLTCALQHWLVVLLGGWMGTRQLELPSLWDVALIHWSQIISLCGYDFICSSPLSNLCLGYKLEYLNQTIPTVLPQSG